MKKLLYWILSLLSDSHFASLRRFLGLQSFYLLISILGFAIFTTIPVTNIQLVQQLGSWFFTIVMTTIVVTTITDVADVIKASKMDNTEKHNFGENPFYDSTDKEIDR